MDSTTLKAQIDTNITNKTVAGSILKTNVGGDMKAIVDYVDQQAPEKTAGSISATNVSPYPELTDNLNTIDTSGASDKVVLPTTAIIGKEVLVFALNNANAFSVRGNQAGSSVLALNGVASFSSSISVAANASYRFIHLGSGYWKAELI
jgi:hypothetical protein